MKFRKSAHPLTAIEIALRSLCLQPYVLVQTHRTNDLEIWNAFRNRVNWFGRNAIIKCGEASKKAKWENYDDCRNYIREFPRGMAGNAI
ncbi:hypothetical protein CDAR_561471 [Caerostris darwini]|uniref:Uncharacterized protein n=1 Tax=Caerostris darwini TaxID=1538125 RepID=A0AAV4T1P9_9ARAC|nr:hypothetical protein CDAR_561471 [Caerostris darwini]